MNPKTRLAIALFLALAAESPVGAAGADWIVYVSPSGNDAWSGRAATATGNDGPLKTLARAQALARGQLAAMAAGRVPRQAVRVEIEPGTYALTTPLHFTAADSGASGSPTVYEAVTPGTVSLSGGETLKAASSTAKQVSYGVPAGKVDWAAAQQLYVGGRRAVLARQPNDDVNWFVAAPGAEGGTKGPFATFGASPEALAWLAALDSDDRSRAVVDVYQSWTSGRHRLAGGASAGEVRIAPAAKWPFLSFGTSQRWFVENVRAALDAPGEWFGDANGVTYLKRPDDGNAPPDAVLPQLESLIAIDGRPADRQWVEYLELRGLGIEHTRFLTPAAGFVDMQAAAAVGAAIEVDGARALTIADCRFAHLGGYGIWLRANVRDSVVADNTLTDLGAGGIKVGLTSQAPGDTTATGAISVSGNTISDTGKIMPGAVGIWVGQSFGNVITKNQISDTTYSGISVGWSWGYAPATSGRNAITSNLLFDIGQGRMSDLGGIYSLGVQPGTVIRGNVIREVRGYRGYGPNRGAGAWGIYEDEGVSQTLIERNVIVGTDSGAYHLHYGHDNTLRNNLFALGKAAELRISNSDDKTNLVAADNLFVTASADPFDVRGASDALFSGNELSPAANAPQGTRCGAGCARSGARLALGAEPRSITLTGASPAIADMVRQTLAEAGPSKPAPTKARMMIAAAPAVATAPPASLELDIAGAPAGQLPAALKYSLGGVPSAIQVVSHAGAQAKGKCLQFADGPEQKNRYDPHAFVELDHAGGTTDATFQLWIDADSDFIHEWRDAAKPYHVGPSMHISARGVESGGKVLLPITPNAWTSFRVSARLGEGAGRWSLQVTDAAGATKTVSDLPDGSAAFNELQWLGFISNASVRSTACLGALKLTNRN